jgi:DNA mismatch repair protein MutS
MFTSNETTVELPIHPALSALEAIQADDLTPKQALDVLYELKALINQG